MSSLPPNLSFALTDRTFTRTVLTPGITFTVIEYSFSTDGGPKQCTIRADGDIRSLEQLFICLRDEGIIRDGTNDKVWWGCLWSAEITNGKISYGFTLDGMANKINIIYLQQTINQAYSGSGTQAETGFSSDTAATADYGTFEKRIRSGNLSATAATAERAKNLANLAYPLAITPKVGSSSGAGGKPFAMIVCKGWPETWANRYYTNNSGAAAGFERNDVVTSEALQLLGMGQAAKTTIGFTSNNFIEDTTASMLLGTASPFNHFFIEGAASNSNIAWQVLTSTEPGRKVTVTPTTVSTEAAGASVVVKHVGQEIKQIISLATDNPFYAAAIDIRLQKSGTPTDNVLVKLYTVSGGLPNVLLATGTITPAEVPTYMSWVTATLDAQVLLSFGTDYIIKVSRSGSVSTDCYIVGVDTGLNYARGAMQLYTNSTLGWVNRLTNADLIFRVAGVVETTTQISNVITSVGEFITGVQIDDASGLRTVPYRDGTQTAKQVVAELAKAGTSNNRRLLMKVTPERKLVLYEEPVFGGATDYSLDVDGELRLRNDSSIPKHKCPYGQWAFIKPLQFAQVPSKQVFIDEVAYNVARDELKIVRTRDRKAEFDITGVDR